jgi:hypothetical protein
MLGERHQSRIWGRVDLLGCRGATRDQACVDVVVLGTLQVENRIGPHLHRLKHNDREPSATQLSDNGLLVATARLDANPLHPMLPQPIRQSLVASGSVADL